MKVGVSRYIVDMMTDDHFILVPDLVHGGRAEIDI